jgi:O-antigen/teichoic acid export membrane protein
MPNLKQKTLHGLLWSFIDSFAAQGIQFLVGIILARILSPKEFGLIGMITIFIAISQSFVDSGFGSALIRKKDCTAEDYSTVFIFNLFVSFLFFLLLVFFAGYISDFFVEPQLKLLVQVLGIGVVLNALGLVQRTILTKNIDFKAQAKISVISSVGSGVLAIVMALNGFGVWSLVALTLSRLSLNSVFLWFWSNWKFSLKFSLHSFKELFGFGSKLLLSGLLDTTYRNVYYLVIGKYFSAAILGQYTRAEQFNSLPSQNLLGIIGRVSYPVLAGLQDDKIALKVGYSRIIRSTMFLTFLLMLCLSAMAVPLVIVLIGNQWLPAAEYLQLLCFVGMLYPLHALNLNMLQVQGRSDLFLKLEIIKKLLAIPTIVIGVLFGVKIMIVGMIVNSLISYYLNSYWSGKLLDYSMKEQVKDILPSLIFSFFIAFCVYLLGVLLPVSSFLVLIFQTLLVFVLVFALGEWIKFIDYIYLKNIVFEKITYIKRNGKA